MIRFYPEDPVPWGKALVQGLILRISSNWLAPCCLPGMATAAPLDRSATTLTDLRREARALQARGLRGEELVRALAEIEPEGQGGSVILRTPEDLDAYLGCAP